MTVNKILFTDFDETLLTTDKKICKENYDAPRSSCSIGQIISPGK